jgi:hypothetical protein
VVSQRRRILRHAESGASAVSVMHHGLHSFTAHHGHCFQRIISGIPSSASDAHHTRPPLRSPLPSIAPQRTDGSRCPLVIDRAIWGGYHIIILCSRFSPGPTGDLPLVLIALQPAREAAGQHSSAQCLSCPLPAFKWVGLGHHPPRRSPPPIRSVRSEGSAPTSRLNFPGKGIGEAAAVRVARASDRRGWPSRAAHLGVTWIVNGARRF